MLTHIYLGKGVVIDMKKIKKVVISENLLNLIIEGRIKVVKGKKLKYGKYRIVRRYVAKV